MKQFDLLGRLNQFGQLQLWKEVDYSIKKFDRHEINLTTREDPMPSPKPRNYNSSLTTAAVNLCIQIVAENVDRTH